MNFYGWIIKKHIATKAPKGDLARDMIDDETFPREGRLQEIRQYLESCGACYDCEVAFESAWKEYMADERKRVREEACS